MHFFRRAETLNSYPKVDAGFGWEALEPEGAQDAI